MTGIEWPIDKKTQKVSTTNTAKTVWIAALTALTDETTDFHFDLDAALVEKARSLTNQIREKPSKEWRHGYVPLLMEHASLMASSLPAAAIEMSHRGLNELNSLMTIERDGEVSSAKDAVLLSSESEVKKDMAFENFLLNGSGDCKTLEKFEMGAPRKNPSDDLERVLTGEAMKAQLKAWADYGCMESSCAASGSDIADLDDISALVKDKVFVLLGATSSLGPMSTLLKIKGATIAAIARPGKKINALMEKVKKEVSDSVTVVFPSREGKGDDIVIGADLIADTPELAQWVANLYPEKQLVICSLAYLDGEKHVRASVGMDLICEYVCEKRKNTALSYLVSVSALSLDAEYKLHHFN